MNDVASVTVVAASAMVADALATAAFVLGPVEGIRLLERQGVDGRMLSPTSERFATREMRMDDYVGDAPAPAAGWRATILPNA